VVLLALTGPLPAQPKDPAELLPADTLAYLELREPGQIAKELSALIKGSDLENMATTLARFREKLPPGADYWRLQDLGVFGLFLSPEVLAEATRMQGAAVAVTGIGKDGEPEVVAVVLAGESHGPTFILRAYLTMDSVRTVGQVEGVTLFRALRRQFVAVRVGGPAQPPPPPLAEEYGPVYALLPGTVIVGTTTQGVQDAVRRLKGKSKGPTLADDATFRTAAGELRGRPGLFGYANLAVLGSKLEELLQPRPGRMVPFTGLLMTDLVSMKTLKTTAASLTLHNGALDLQAQVRLDPRQQGPLMEMLPGGKADLHVMHAVPRDSLFAATIALPDGEKRWQRMLALADSIAQKVGAGDQVPSKHVRNVEGVLGLKFGPDVFSKISGATVAVIPPTKGARQLEPSFLVLLATVDADAAKSLGDVLPKLVGLASGGETPSPTTERVQGQRVRSLPGDSLPWRSPLHYGHQGKLLALGQERRMVAQALIDAGKEGGLLGQETVAQVIGELQEPFAVAVVPIGRLMLQWISIRSIAPDPVAVPASAVPPPGPAGALAGRSDSKLMHELAPTLDALPPLVIGLTRKPDRLLLTVHQADLSGRSTAVINALIQASLHTFGQSAGMRFAPAAGAIAPLPPPASR
jgi:hypothetical protein